MVERIVLLRILSFIALHIATANSFSLLVHRHRRPPLHQHHGRPSSASASAVVRAAKQPRAVGSGSGAGSAAEASAAAVVVEDEDEDEDEGGGCRVLLLDHLNINHEKGRHDALNAFYFDFLGCGIDPRKHDNYLAGEKTVWANAGMHQFHLPEGDPHAQVFDGMITLIHDDLDLLMERYEMYLDGDPLFAPLRDTEFLVGVVGEDDDDDDEGGYMMLVTDPWGTEFCILPSDDPEEDRASHVGTQPSLEGGIKSHVLAMEDLTVYVEHSADLDGIGRFYEYVLGAKRIDELCSSSSVCVGMGERQTLTFARHPDGPDAVASHHDFGDIVEGIDDAGGADDDDDDDDRPPPTGGGGYYPPNRGPHVSVYVTDLAGAYRKAEELGVLYVNARFERRAHTLEQAIDQCMFRMIDVVDPLDGGGDVIVRLEHEVRSATTRDGTRYKSCPLFAADATV